MSFEELDKRLEKYLRHSLGQQRYYRRVREEVIRKLGGKCFYCPVVENLEIHEKVPVLKGHGKRRGAETIRNWKEGLKTGNLVLVCREHHIQNEHNGNVAVLKKLNGS